MRAGHRKKSDPVEKASPADIFKQRAEKDKPGRRGYGEFCILFPVLFCIKVEVHKAKARKDNTCIVLDPFEDKYDHRLYSMTFYNIRIQMSFSYPIILKDLLPGSRLIVNHAVSASESGQHHP